MINGLGTRNRWALAWLVLIHVSVSPNAIARWDLDVAQMNSHVAAAEAPRGAHIPLGDIADVVGVRDNQLVGFGLVVGLNRTGDGTQAEFTIQALVNAMQRMGVVSSPDDIRVRNTAAVMVTANLAAFARPGARLDVNVASIGDAKSIAGGVLLMTPLKGPDGKVYALAQGAVSIGGGFSAGGGGSSVQKNHPTTGMIPGGALVERSAGIEVLGRNTFDLALRKPNFVTAMRVEKALMRAFDVHTAAALDAGRIRLTVPETMRDDPVGFLAMALDVKVSPRTRARVVLNERTGTVVLGGDVRISQVSVTHGNLIISVAVATGVSQPAPFSGGQTVVTEQGEVVTEEESGKTVTMEDGANVASLVSALNKMGVSPRDMIAIFQAIHAAGALHAELEVI